MSLMQMHEFKAGLFYKAKESEFDYVVTKVTDNHIFYKKYNLNRILGKDLFMESNKFSEVTELIDISNVEYLTNGFTIGKLNSKFGCSYYSIDVLKSNDYKKDDRLLVNNKKITWIPLEVKEGSIWARITNGSFIFEKVKVTKVSENVVSYYNKNIPIIFTDSKDDFIIEYFPYSG